MDETIIEKSKMDGMKALAEASLKISEAKNTLFKLEETETEYLVAREKKAMDKMDKIINDSKNLLDQAKNNYEEVHVFYKTITEYAKYLEETYEQFQKMLDSFERKNDLWDSKITGQQQEIATLKKIIEQDKEEILKDRFHIESQQQSLLASRENLKNLWEKNK